MPLHCLRRRPDEFPDRFAIRQAHRPAVGLIQALRDAIE